MPFMWQKCCVCGRRDEGMDSMSVRDYPLEIWKRLIHMKQTRKVYAPVTEFERQTSYCPLYLAWRILDEARDYFRTPIPEAFADKLAHRAEAVFAHHPFWQRKFSASATASARQAILMAMRHWLAGELTCHRSNDKPSQISL